MTCLIWKIFENLKKLRILYCTGGNLQNDQRKRIDPIEQKYKPYREKYFLQKY